MAYFSVQKKGLSPLIAVVLLVVFTIGIATIIMSWMNSYTKDTTYQASQDSAGVIGCAGVNVEIEEVYILSENSVKVFARNTGLKPLIYKEAYIWDTNGTRCMLNITESTVEKGVSFELINDSCPITFTSECPEFAKVTLSTSCGVTARFEDISKLECKI